jgi:hypothetical protein
VSEGERVGGKSLRVKDIECENRSTKKVFRERKKEEERGREREDQSQLSSKIFELKNVGAKSVHALSSCTKSHCVKNERTMD